MRSLRVARKFRSLLSFQVTIFLLLCILIVNIYLFYHLRFIGYQQNTVNVLQNELQPIKSRARNKTDLKETISKPACKVGNYSVFISDLILQLKEDLEEFYLHAKDFSVLKSRYDQFLQTSQSETKTDLLLTENKIDLASNQLLTILKKATVLKVQNAPKGSQLKLLAHLSDNITAIVKPKWYSPTEIIIGPVYAGKDRHYGEVVAFYLSILLDLPRVPPAVIRFFDLQKEIISRADEKLLSTFILKDNKTCFYGVCPYCNPLDLLCTNSKTLEGSLLYHLSSSFSLKVLQHPWRRTYRCSAVARWEIEANYCARVRSSRFYSNVQHRAVFLDLVDVAIFDFLISNGDRHHYEIVKSFKIPRILMVDNGKSFGNPYTDHIDILAPLYQCCTIRNSTWSSLLHLRGGGLSRWLKRLLESSDCETQVNAMHLQALDRRLLLVFATLKYCFQKIGMQNVLVHE